MSPARRQLRTAVPSHPLLPGTSQAGAVRRRILPGHWPSLGLLPPGFAGENADKGATVEACCSITSCCGAGTSRPGTAGPAVSPREVGQGVSCGQLRWRSNSYLGLCNRGWAARCCQWSSRRDRVGLWGSSRNQPAYPGGAERSGRPEQDPPGILDVPGCSHVGGSDLGGDPSKDPAALPHSTLGPALRTGLPVGAWRGWGLWMLRGDPAPPPDPGERRQRGAPAQQTTCKTRALPAHGRRWPSVGLARQGCAFASTNKLQPRLPEEDGCSCGPARCSRTRLRLGEVFHHVPTRLGFVLQ